MWFRRISLVVAIAILIAGFGINKLLSAQKEESPRKITEAGLVALQVQTVRNGPVQTQVPLTGRLRANQKIEIFSEVTGKYLDGGKAFQEGVFFRKGEPLLRLDNSDQCLQLVAQRATFQSQLIRLLPDLKIDYPAQVSAFEQYLYQFDPEKSIPALPEVADQKLKNFLSVNNIFNLYYNIVSAEAQLAKFSIYAPFDGVLVQGDLDPGNLVRAGAKVGELLNPGQYELEASVAQPDLAYINVGQKVQLGEEGSGNSWPGTIDRISQSVDPGTQTVKVYINVTGQGLREGVYLHGMIYGADVANAVLINRGLIRDDNTVWIVENGQLALRSVTVLYSFGDQQVVQGLQDQDQLVIQRIPGGYAGMDVRISDPS